MILYEGPSLLTGEPIVVIATVDGNPKIGEQMLCTYVLLQGILPSVAANQARDAGICGDCKWRARDGERFCYVRLTLDGSDGHPPADEKMPPDEVWRKWKAGYWSPAGEGYDTENWTRQPATFRMEKVDYFPGFRTAEVSDGLLTYRGPLPVRIGSYGDPAAVPTRVWAELVRYAKNWTGYTHQHKPKRCSACAQENQKKATCADGGTVSLDNLRGAGNGTASGREQATGSSGIVENKSMPIDLRCSGSQVGGHGSLDTPATIPSASIPDISEEEPTRTTCETALQRAGTNQDSPVTTSGVKTGNRLDAAERQETSEAGSCEKCNGTGYEWQPDPDLKRYCMASVDTLTEWDEAKAAGWVSFIVAPKRLDTPEFHAFMRSRGAVYCPMTAGKPVTCARCCLCKGTSGPARDIYEFSHGVNAELHTAWR